MKKMLIAVLVAAMCVSPFISGAQAVEPIGKDKQVTENNRWRGYDYRRRRYHGGSGSAGAIVAGSLLLGAAIVAAASKPKKQVYVQPAPVYVQPAPVYVQPQQPTLVCDQYGNCWYQ